MSSIFGDLDVANAEDNPFEVEAGTYEATVTDVQVKPTAKGDKTGLILEYTITDESNNGKKVSEWKEIPDKNSPNAARAASFLKMRLASLGVPEGRMNDLQTDDLMNLDVVVTVTKSTGKDGTVYTNVNKVVLNEGNTGDISFS